MSRIDVAIAIIIRDGKVLICQRRNADRFGGYWEFPGGKCELDETPEQCLARELQEELSLTARPIHSFEVIEHDYPDIQVRLHPFLCQHESGEPQLIACQAACWIELQSLPDFHFPPANAELIQTIIHHLYGRASTLPG